MDDAREVVLCFDQHKFKNMKTFFILLLSLLLSNSILSQSYIDKKGNKHLWGEVQLDELTSGEYQEWFEKNQKDFTTELSKKDGALFEGIQVEIFIGTWCGDTKYLVPKFIKCWEAMGLNKDDLKITALHNDEENYKQGPNNETQNRNIHRVPTFVFEKNQKELGRIVERTVFDLDTDMKAIASGDAYEERYQGVSLLNEFIGDVEADSLIQKSTIQKAYKLVRREVTTSSELNTYGYVLLAEDKKEQAEMIFRLNRFLFPYNPNTRDSYGEILFKMGKLEAAKTEYLEALRLKMDDSHVISQLALINEQLESKIN